MRPTLREVFGQLVEEGRIAGEDEKRLRDVLAGQVAQETPWYLQGLIGAGAWISTGLFLLFLFLVDLVDDEAAMAVVGLLMVGVAVVLRRRTSAVFAVQLALAGSFVGQLLVVGAISGSTREETAAAVVGLLVSAILIWIFPDPVHRFLSTLAAILSVAVLLWEWDQQLAPEVAYALLSGGTAAWWMRRPALSGLWADLWSPVGHGLALSLLSASALFGTFSWEFSPTFLTPAALGVVGVYVLLRLFGVPGRTVDRVVVASLAATLLLVVVAARVPGLLAAMLVMVLATHRRNPLLLGEAVVAFVCFLAWYYYSLEVTLLQKAAALILSGGLLLGAWRLLAHPRWLTGAR